MPPQRSRRPCTVLLPTLGLTGGKFWIGSPESDGGVWWCGAKFQKGSAGFHLPFLLRGRDNALVLGHRVGVWLELEVVARAVTLVARVVALGVVEVTQVVVKVAQVVMQVAQVVVGVVVVVVAVGRGRDEERVVVKSGAGRGASGRWLT